MNHRLLILVLTFLFGFFVSLGLAFMLPFIKL